MKRFCAALLIGLIVFLSVVITNAEDTVGVSALADGALKNRLFEISVQAKPQSDICAGEITLYYDNSIVEFREVNSDSYYVEAKDSVGEVKVVFGSAYFEDSQNAELFRVKFKAVSEGSFDLGVFCSDFIDEKLSDVSVKASDLQITVDKNSVKSKSVKKAQTEKGSELITEETESVNFSTADELFINHDDENRISGLFIVCIALAVVVAFLLGVLFSRKSVLEENDDDESNDWES